MIQINHYGSQVIAEEEITTFKRTDLPRDQKRVLALRVILSDKDKNVVLHDYRVDYDGLNETVEDAMKKVVGNLLYVYPGIKFSPHDRVSRNVIMNFSAARQSEYDIAWNLFSHVDELKIKGK